MGVALSDLYPEFTNMNIKTLLFKVYDIFTPTEYKDLAMVNPSTLASEIYPTMGPGPKMTKLTSEIKLQSFDPKQGFQVWNDEYATARQWKRTAFMNDQYGIISHEIAQLAIEGKRKPVELVYNCIQYGDAAPGNQYYNPGFDGVPLFSASHPGASNQTNILNETLSATALQDGIAMMMNLTDEDGRPLDFMPDTLITTPANWLLARQLVGSAFFMSVGPSTGSGPTTNIPTSNEFKDVIKNVIITSYLNRSSTEWFLADTSAKRGTKPVVLQEREAPFVTVKMDPATSDYVDRTSNHTATIKAQWGCAPLDWHTIVQGHA